MYELRKRIKESVIMKPVRLREYCRMNLAHKPTEEMHVMYLDESGRVMCTEINDIGTVNRSNVYPDKILARALLSGARRIVLFHNHPVGDCTASRPDVQMTMDLGRVLLHHGIKIQDHLIIDAFDMIYSMRDAHALDELDVLEARMLLKQISDVTDAA